MIFRGAPFLRYLLVASFSIIFCIFNLEFLKVYSIYNLSIAGLLCIILYLFGKKHRTFQSLVGYFLIGIISMMSVKMNTEKCYKNHLSNIKYKIDYYQGYVSNEPEEKDKTIKFIFSVEKIRVNNNWIDCKAKVLTYLFKSKNAFLPKYGDKFIVNGSPDTTTIPRNPGEFNLKQFYSFHQIYHQKFISTDQIYFIGNQENNPLTALAISIRKWAENIFKTYIQTERERKIASALILGIKSTLDWEIMQAYANTGTMHVLAVSGLHVGIIYQLLLMLCFWSKNIKNGRWIKAAFLLVALWFYALVTGLCPSILRSVTMFSFIIIADAINRKSNIYNTLAASCLFLLCYNPYMIMEVGFQLSYLAVLGIVYLQPKLYALIHTQELLFRISKFEWIDNSLKFTIDWAWAITCVSIAAQIATFPLGVLYFHQFPSYFLLSNLAVIPAAIGIMYIGLVFVMFAKVKLVASFLGVLIQNMVYYLNCFIIFIEDLPFSVWKGLSISVLNTWHIYLIIILILIFFNQHRFYWLIFSVLAICALMIQFSYEIYKCKNQKSFTVYALNSGFAIDKFIGTETHTLVDSSTLKNPSKMQFHILNNRWKNQISNENAMTNFRQIGKNDFVFLFEGKTFLVYKNNKINTENLPFDYKISLNKYERNSSEIFETQKNGAFEYKIID